MSSGNPETRKRILEATWKLMVERHGIDVMVDEVARRVKVSRQAVYLYFRTRADLLIATVRYVDEVLDVNKLLEVVCSASTGVEILDGMVEFWGNYIPKIHGLAKALLAVYDSDQDAAAAWNDRMTALKGGCRIAIERLRKENRLMEGWDVEEATSMMWSLMSISVWEAITLRESWSNEQYIRRLQEVMRRTFIGPY